MEVNIEEVQQLQIVCSFGLIMDNPAEDLPIIYLFWCEPNNLSHLTEEVLRIIFTLHLVSSTIHNHIDYDEPMQLPSVQNSETINNLDDSKDTNRNDITWCPEYYNDILQHLRSIEEKRVKMGFKSQQVCYRPELLNLVKKIGDCLCLQNTTIHLAMYLLDRFMDSYSAKNSVLSCLEALTIACVLLASKLEEAEENMPKICELMAVYGKSLSEKYIKRLEKVIIKHFDYNLFYPTAATFIELYSPYLLKSEFMCSKQADGINLTVENVLEEYRNILLEDHRLTGNQKPSLMAASCLAATRKTCNIHPIWPTNLVNLTTYEYKDLKHNIETLIKFRKQLIDTKNESNSLFRPSVESGYLSGSSESFKTPETKSNNEESSNSDSSSDEENSVCSSAYSTTSCYGEYLVDSSDEEGVINTNDLKSEEDDTDENYSITEKEYGTSEDNNDKNNVNVPCQRNQILTRTAKRKLQAIECLLPCKRKRI